MSTPMDPHFLSVHGLSISADLPRPSESLSVSSISSRLGCREIQHILLLASAENGDPPSMRSRTARFTSQINRYWRACALSLPALWVGPALSRWYSQLPWLDIVLQRSDPLPFDAIIPPAAPQTVIGLVLQHLRRIRVLEFEIHTLEAWAQVETALRENKAMHLQKFSINVSLTLSMSERRRRQLPASSSKNLFCGCAPSLTEFKTSYYPVDLTPKLFYNLKVLVIDKIQFVPVPHLLDVLRNMTGLEELEITRPAENVIWHKHFEASISTPHPIAMSSLRKLSVSAPISVCAEILRDLTIQGSTCDIRLHCLNACFGRDLREVTSRLETTLGQWQCEPYTGQLSMSIGPSYITFSVQGSVNYSDCQPPSICLKVSWPDQYATTLDNFFALFPSVAKPFCRYEEAPDTLALFCELEMVSTPDGLSALRPVLKHFLRALKDHIQRIIFTNQHSFDLFGPLLGPAHNDPDGNSSEVLLLVLGDLILEDINFRVHHREQWKRLLRILRWREAAGFPVHEVDFVRCTGNYSQSIPVKCGIEVKVDGVYLSDYSENDDGDSDYTILGESD